MTSNSATVLRDIFAAGRPLVEQWLDIGEQMTALRIQATEAGIEWSQVKALLKAQIQDERDESGNGKRVEKMLTKADTATAYADMLGLGTKRENKFISDPAGPLEPGEAGGLVKASPEPSIPTPEPVAQQPSPARDGEPPAGVPLPSVGGDPFADRQPPPIPDFLRRTK